jgi:hypothetical protein
MYNLALMFKHNKPARYGLGGLGYRPIDFRGMIGGSGIKGGMLRGKYDVIKVPGRPKQEVNVFDDDLVDVVAAPADDVVAVATDEDDDEDDVVLDEELQKQLEEYKKKPLVKDDLLKLERWKSYIIKLKTNNLVKDDYTALGKILQGFGTKRKQPNATNAQRLKKLMEQIETLEDKITTSRQRSISTKKKSFINKQLKKNEKQRKEDEKQLQIELIGKTAIERYRKEEEEAKKLKEEKINQMPPIVRLKKELKEKINDLDIKSSQLLRLRTLRDEAGEKELIPKMKILDNSITDLKKRIEELKNPKIPLQKQYITTEVFNNDVMTSINEHDFSSIVEFMGDKYSEIMQFFDENETISETYGIKLDEQYIYQKASIDRLFLNKEGLGVLKEGQILEVKTTDKDIAGVIYDTIGLEIVHNNPVIMIFDSFLQQSQKANFIIDGIDFSNGILNESKKYDNVYKSYVKLVNKYNEQYDYFFNRMKLEIMRLDEDLIELNKDLETFLFLKKNLKNLEDKDKTEYIRLKKLNLEELIEENKTAMKNILNDISDEDGFNENKFDCFFHKNFPYCGISIVMNKFIKPKLDDFDFYGANNEAGYKNLIEKRGTKYNLDYKFTKEKELLITQIKREGGKVMIGHTVPKDEATKELPEREVLYPKLDDDGNPIAGEMGRNIFQRKKEDSEFKLNKDFKYIFTILVGNALLVFNYSDIYRRLGIEEYTSIANIFRGNHDPLEESKEMNSITLPMKYCMTANLLSIFPDMKPLVIKD